MTVHWGALQPENEAPRRSCQTDRGTANFINSNTTIDTFELLKSQVGRIIATHWLRPETWEAANG